MNGSAMTHRDTNSLYLATLRLCVSLVVLTIGLTITALDGPIIIAMIVNVAVPVEEKSVLAVFKG